MGIETALIGGAIIGGVGSLVGGSMARDAAGDAADKQARALKEGADAAAEAELKKYYQQREDMAPWIDAGRWALGAPSGGYPADSVQAQEKARDLGSFDPNDYLDMYPDVRAWAEQASRQNGMPVNQLAFSHWSANGRKEGRYANIRAKQAAEAPVQPQNALADGTGDQQGGTGLVGMIERGPGEFVPEEDPGYKFGYSEFVEKPTLRAAAATGTLGGGKTQKALTRYASDYASTKYDDFLRRYYDKLRPYQSLAGVGQTATSGLNTTQTGNSLANIYGNLGSQLGSVYGNQAINQGNANLATVNSLTGIGQSALNTLLLKKMGVFN